jgi:hypothetical protein
MSETEKQPTAEDAVESGGTFADQVAGLTDDQLKVVKQTVMTEAGKREQPNYAGMSDAEFREQVRKRHGYNPV